MWCTYLIFHSIDAKKFDMLCLSWDYLPHQILLAIKAHPPNPKKIQRRNWLIQSWKLHAYWSLKVPSSSSSRSSQKLSLSVLPTLVGIVCLLWVWIYTWLKSRWLAISVREREREHSERHQMFQYISLSLMNELQTHIAKSRHTYIHIRWLL